MPEDITYAPLELSSLHLNGQLNCDFFIEKKQQFSLYRGASAPFTMTECHSLLAIGVTNLWIPIAPPDWPASGLLKILDLSDAEFPPRSKAKLVYTGAVDTTKHAFTVVSKQSIEKLDGLIGVLANYLTSKASAFAAMIAVAERDTALYSHAINVALYAMGLAIYLGMRDLEELKELGLGAALRDIGEMSLPGDLLNKRKGLTAEEWEILRGHPEKGIEVLRAAVELPDTVLDIVVQHHERNDGSGYPKGLKESELHPFAKIVSLVDAYDAMTSPRPHRAPRSPYNALLELKKEVGGRYSLEFFTNLLTILADPAQVGAGIGPE